MPCLIGTVRSPKFAVPSFETSLRIRRGQQLPLGLEPLPYKECDSPKARPTTSRMFRRASPIGNRSRH